MELKNVLEVFLKEAGYILELIKDIETYESRIKTLEERVSQLESLAGRVKALEEQVKALQAAAKEPAGPERGTSPGEGDGQGKVPAGSGPTGSESNPHENTWRGEHQITPDEGRKIRLVWDAMESKRIRRQLTPSQIAEALSAQGRNVTATAVRSALAHRKGKFRDRKQAKGEFVGGVISPEELKEIRDWLKEIGL